MAPPTCGCADAARISLATAESSSATTWAAASTPSRARTTGDCGAPQCASDVIQASSATPVSTANHDPNRTTGLGFSTGHRLRLERVVESRRDHAEQPHRHFAPLREDLLGGAEQVSHARIVRLEPLHDAGDLPERCQHTGGC